ncbi:CaiB/BaiF CoA transferase family protein [Sediminimonas qiaohouensis]|uniref:CaiB/BaiF CoA transferase family protein n=1 Tax=Sediminimonas qiaohouensis TaxID=552061 RepID=UPI00055A96DF|nr:CaiB/BaiF CoA-transferase family protein [Sediminimonas qiaohouensis]
MSTAPLADLKILSLAEQFPGPYATMLLSDMGAEVIMIERPGVGDPARQFPPLFSALNRGKRSVALDLKSAEGPARFRDLAKSADVIVEGFRPGKLAALGIGFEDMRRVNPRLVYVSISGYGQDGPYRDRAGHDLSYEGVSGLLADQADAGRPGQLPAIPLADIGAALFAAIAILSAVVSSQRTGQGRYVDVSMSDAVVSMLTAFLVPAANGTPLGEFISEPAYGVFTCKDGKLMTLSIAHEDWFWKPFCGVIGKPDLVGLKGRDRVAQKDALREEIAAVLVSKSRADWGDLFDKAGVPWGPLNSLVETLEDPHVRARRLLRTIAHDSGKTETFLVQPLKFDDFDSEISGLPPEIGADNESVFAGGSD